MDPIWNSINELVPGRKFHIFRIFKEGDASYPSLLEFSSALKPFFAEVCFPSRSKVGNVGLWVLESG